MKKLQTLAFYALVTPVITLGAGSVLADQSTGQNSDREHQSSQRDHRATQSTPGASNADQRSQRAGQSDARSASDRQSKHDKSSMDKQGYLESVPANGMQASNLIGADVKTASNKDVGSVDDLIIDKDGQVVAIVVGVGGFLGMGQKDVAISWDKVTKSGGSDEQGLTSGTSDDLELRIDLSREELRSAKEFKKQE